MTVRDELDLHAIAFDVYGTIANINSRRAPFRKLLRYAEEAGRTPQPDDAFNIMAFPGSIREVADRLGISLPVSVALALEADLIAELESVTLFDDVNDTLRALKERGLKIALCSNLAEPYAAPSFASYQCHLIVMRGVLPWGRSSHRRPFTRMFSRSSIACQRKCSSSATRKRLTLMAQSKWGCRPG